MRYCLLLLSWLCLPLMASAQPSAPAPELQEQYQELAERAVAAHAAGHFLEARDLFQRAHALWPSARTFRTLGMTAFDLELYPEAVRELQAALDDTRRPLDAKQRRQLRELIDKAREHVGIFTLTISPADAQLTVDDRVVTAEQPLVLTPGQHRLVARAPGHEALQRTLLVKERQDEILLLTLPVTPPQPSAAVPVPAAALTTVASPPVDAFAVPRSVALVLGAVGVATGITAGILAMNKRATVKRECDRSGCSQDGLDAGAAGRRWMVVSDVGSGVGVLGFVTWLLLPGGFLNGRADERGVALVVRGELL